MIRQQMQTIEYMETKIHKIKPNVAHKPSNVRKHPCFKLIRKNNEDIFQYVTVRAQRSGVQRAMEKSKVNILIQRLYWSYHTVQMQLI